MSAASVLLGRVAALVDEGGLARGVDEHRDRVVGRRLDLLRDLLVGVDVGRERDRVLAQELLRRRGAVVAVDAEERDLAAALGGDAAGRPGTPRGTGCTTRPTC